VIAWVEFVIRLFVPPTPVIDTVYMFACVELKVQVAVTLTPAASVADAGQVTMSPAGEDVELRVTTPANPKVAAGLPRLVRVTSTPFPGPVVGKLTLVELEAILYPLIRIDNVP
jgi:hypothetical protein